MQYLPSVVYVLCGATAIFCTVLLARTYLRTRARLLLWSALCFAALSASNILLFLDIIVLPTINLLLMRHLFSLLAVSILIYGFIWEAD
jgi:hypothetical protein